jgi:GH15 family glucan-1,4-alpha-glucosidase
MSLPLESYALIGDLQTAALVSRTGSVDWLCLPRFDGPAVFAALLGDDRHGSWRIAAAGQRECTSRRYRDDSLILETTWETQTGTARVIDFMPPRGEAPDIVRVVEGVSGRVELTSEMRLRFDYGSVRPMIDRIDGGIRAVAGPDAVYVDSPIEHTETDDGKHLAAFAVDKGDRVPFVLTWQASHRDRPEPVDANAAETDTDDYWSEWVGRCTYDGEWRDAVVRSLVTLRALTYEPTAGIVAAVTTSLPEALGGACNWDYRYCWLRDATMTLHALVYSGYDDEARRWRDWLLRALGGDPHRLRIMYGVAGERRVHEHQLDWLPGYENSQPVRVGNNASKQFQLDVFGEVLDAFHLDRSAGLTPTEPAWSVQRDLLDVLESRWHEPDSGLWEMRDDPRQFVHSKVMAWAGFDRAVQAVERCGLDGPVDRWRRLRDEVHAEVCERGYDAERNTFVQSYGSPHLDASALLIPHTGFLPADDPRIAGTVDAIGRELSCDGLLFRYSPDAKPAGIEDTEATFTACTLWYADALHLVGRAGEARAVFERVLDLRNDVGLLSEEYDVPRERQVGNLPQAFSHVALVTAARALSATGSGAGRVHRQDPPKLR